MKNPKQLMMKRIFTLLFLIAGFTSIGQYNNEWINHGQQYYKFKIGSKGLYRISKTVLDNAGIGGASVENLELWRNGEKVPFYTTAATGPLTTGGYIEFWGEGNDGKPDKVLYRNAAYQHTTERSLLSDTAVYFLSVNTTQTGFRYSEVANDVNGNVLPAEQYFMHKAATYYNNKINPGFAAVVGEYVYSSSYDKGEFWSSGPITPSSPLTTTHNSLPVYSGGPAASLRYGAMGDALNARTLRVSVNSTLLQDTIMDYFTDVHATVNVPLSLISSGNVSVNFVNTSGVGTDRLVISYFELTYPRVFNFANAKNFKFSLPASGAKYLEITNFDGGASPVLLNLTTGERIVGNTAVGGMVRFAIGAGGARDFVLVNTDASNVTNITALTAKTFKQYLNPVNQGDYLIITNKILFTGTTGNNPIEDYKAYRASAAGGGYNPLIVDIDELVDQFGLGIKQNPICIKNFLRFARNNFSATPKYVFIIGRGMCYNDFRTRESDPIANQLNLVPTFGYPGSDNLLSSGNVVDPIAITPIGRLSVVHSFEIENYLEKMKEYESVQRNAPNTIDAREWMKNVMHITGSSDPYLGTVLCNYMGVYKQTIQDTAFGAKVSTFCKASTNPNDAVNAEKIANQIEKGLSILTYFGHSSTTTLDFNIENPENYENQGKYPVFFVNGCNAGNFFTYNLGRLSVNETLSEKFVLAKQHGSIAFVASTHYGIVNYLNIYLNSLYEALAHNESGRSLGELTRNSLQKMVIVTGPSDYYARLHAEEMTIHGDPAVHINEQLKPDYVIEDPQVRITPSFISLAEESASVKIRVANIGLSSSDSIYVNITRQYPDGSTELIYREKLPGIRYADSIVINLPIVATRDKGLNKLLITLDADNFVDEISESNNTVVKEFHVFEDEVRGIYPYNYSIINNASQKLIASTANPFSLQKNYIMEIDTTAMFNSSLKVTKTTSSLGGIIEFDPAFTFADSTVYYWRVASVPANNGTYQWHASSFMYSNSIPEGFNQSGYFQHTESGMDRIVIDSTTRKWKYGLNTNQVFIRNGVFPTAASFASDFIISINNSDDIRSICGVSGIIFNVFDPVTLKPWFNALNGQPGQYGSDVMCGDERKYNFQFNLLDPNKRRKMVEFVDLVPAGHLLVVRNISGINTATNTYASTWMGDTSFMGSNNSIYHRLLEQGFTGIDSFSSPRAWIFICKKDNQSTFPPKFVFSQGINDKIALSTDVQSPDSLGFVTSPKFGPATAWHNVIWQGESIESPTNDNPVVSIIGVDNNNAETVLYNLDKNTHNFDISSVSALQYPYMRLKMRNIDSLTLTPAQLKYWRIHYDPVPEGALAGNIFVSSKDTLQTGEMLKFGIAFKNVSKHAFDSLLVKATIVGNDNVSHDIPLPKYKPIIAGDTILVQFELDVEDYPGNNTIFLDVNPAFDQPEQQHFNNFLYKNFYVNSDNASPLLDVTFDGVHILNDDLVSAKPHIRIKLTDNAKYLLLNDTALSIVQVRYPDGTLHTFNYNTDTLRFTPATGSDNSAIIDFNPYFLGQYNESGEDQYELIVKAKDRSGNKAGGNDFRIAFRVINKAMISNLLNYPNPFSTSTAFVFTLTGSEVPENIKIQVLTVTGKIVREITKQELGPIRIGRNITEFKWDGTDQFGQKLANGVYLYRFITSLNGKKMDKYKAKGDNTDKFFNNGYGKMYLMR